MRTVFAVFLLLIAQPLRARQNSIDRWLVDTWTTEDGLPQNSVNGIAQTSDGYLWLGTFGGLARFDGIRFTAVPRVDSAGTHLDRITGLSAGRGDTLWLASENGVLRYTRDGFRQWSREQGYPWRHVVSVLAMPDGSVWLTAGGGLFRLHGDDYTLLDAQGNGGLTRDAQGLVWQSWGTRGSFVYRVRPDGSAERDTVWTGAPLSTLQFNGQRWLTDINAGEIMRINGVGRTGATRTWMRAHGVRRPHWIARDSVGTLWIGNMNTGLDAFEPDAADGRYVTQVAPGDVTSMFVDAEGTVWAGTNGRGLMRVRHKVFDVAAQQVGVTTTVMQERSGRLWVGGNCAGVYRADSIGASFTRYITSNGNQLACPTSLAEGSDGAVWVGGYMLLVRIVDDIAMPVLGSNGRGIGNVVALHVARDGTVWGGRYGNGLYHFTADGRLLRHYTRADGIGNPDIRFVTTDSTGVVWFGGTGGLGRLRGDSITWYTTANGLPADYVRAILPRADGTVWIGTYGGGLARFRDGRFVTIRAQHGLSDDAVSSILEDDAGHFWMSGNRGVYRARIAELDAFADGRLSRVHSILYGRADGMLNAETNGGGQPAAWRGNDGRLWFPTLIGAVSVDPTRADLEGPPPPAVIEEIAVNGVSLDDSALLELPPGMPSVEVRYTGLSFTAPEHIVFRYRLVGYDDAWTDAGTRRVAYFPRLPPGRYRFEVSAANRNGEWGAPAVLTLRARPTLAQSPLFRALLLLLTIAAIGAIVRQRILRARREHDAQKAFSRALLDSQEAERRRIAAELHDGLGQDLLLVKNYAALALSEHDDTHEHVRMIGELATDALASVRALAHTLTPRQLDHVGITRALSDVLARADAASNVRVTAALDDVDDVFSMPARINLFRIVQESVTNSLKHADAKQIDVRLVRTPANVRLTISDDGRGFDVRAEAAEPARGIGLDGIRQRIAMLGGTFTLESAPGAGTRLAATLPLSKDET